MSIDQDLLYRLVTRCGEIAGEPGMVPSVTLVYSKSAAAPMAAYVAAYEAVAPKTTARTQAQEDVARLLGALEKPYREARTLALSFVEGVVLPETLRSAATDTDRGNAIRALQRLLDDHKAEDWVVLVNAGAFAAAAPPALEALRASTAASTALSVAETKRAEAFEPAYQAVITMKSVVRDGLGRNTAQYRSLRIPRSGAAKQATAKATTAKAPAKPAITAPDGTGAAAAPAPDPAPGGK